MQSRVAAGLPSVAHEGPAEGLAIDAHLIKRPSRTFLLQVKGDSMQGAGILAGDTLIVERANAAKEGDIVVAMVEDYVHGQAPCPGEASFCAPAREQGLSGAAAGPAGDRGRGGRDLPQSTAHGRAPLNLPHRVVVM